MGPRLGHVVGRSQVPGLLIDSSTQSRIPIINGANWFFISHLCSFLMWSCSLLPLPILAIQTLASSLYLCFPFCRSFSTFLFPFRFLLSCRLYPCPRLHRTVTTHSGLRLVDEMLHRFCRSLARRCNLCPPPTPPQI